MNIQNVVAAVIEIENTYLVCCRPPYKRYGGLWEFPGGKVEQGESFGAAVARELMEELSLVVESVNGSLFNHQDPGSAFMVHFISVKVSGSLELHEHSEARWCSIEELEIIPLTPSDRIFVDFLRK